MKHTTTRVRERFDDELALTNDLLGTAQRLAVSHGWRVATRAIYYVLIRIVPDRGRRQLAEFLSDSTVGW